MPGLNPNGHSPKNGNWDYVRMIFGHNPQTGSWEYDRFLNGHNPNWDCDLFLGIMTEKWTVIIPIFLFTITTMVKFWKWILLYRKTFLSEAENRTYWRRKPLSPAEGRPCRPTLKNKTTNLFINDFYAEKLSAAMPRMGHTGVENPQARPKAGYSGKLFSAQRLL